MQKQIELLVELQEVDSQIQKLESERGDLPQLVEALRKTITTLSSKLHNERNELDECSTKRRQTEGDLELIREQLKKFQKQLYSVVTSNREYDAITTEIENAEIKIDAMETEILELEDREENLEEDIKGITEQIASEETKLKVSEENLQKRLAETEQIEKDLATKRSKLVNQVSAPIFSRYERIRKAKNGLAVVSVKQSTCQGCFTTIPPQRGLEIRQKDHMILCETCGRILIWENGE